MHFKLSKILSSFLFITAMVGCVQDRDDQEVQGADLDLLQEFIVDGNQTGFNQSKTTAGVSCSDSSLFKTTDYSIFVTEELNSIQNTTAERIIIEDGVQDFLFLNEVRFTSDDPLLNDRSEATRMLGRTGDKYGVVYQYTPKHVIINKLVKPDQISHYEKTYSCELNGNWLVPVGGYDVTYFNVARVVDPDNRETNLINKFVVDPSEFRTAASYMIDRESFQRFERAENKVDVFSKEFFEGEWYFSTTNVATRFGASTFTGNLGGLDAGFNLTSKVFFSIEEDFIFAFNTNIDETLQNEEHDLDYDTALQIPIENVLYQREVENSNFVGLTESEREDADIDLAPYIRVNFRDVQTPSRAGIGSLADILGRIIFGSSESPRKVSTLRIAPGYISFMVEDGDRDTLTRYAFRKIMPETNMRQAYETRRQYFSDFEKFGAFDVVKAQKFDFRVARKEDLDKNFLMARHNPKKDIVYRFSTLTPKDDYYRDIGREVMQLWQQAFEKAGLDIKIILDESEDAELGDIRYNVLNIPDANQVGLLGFGPSLIDTDTGEIISATTNTYVGTIIESQYAMIRNYLGRKSGVFFNFKKGGETTINPIVNLLDSVNSNLMYYDRDAQAFLPLYGQELLDERGNIDYTTMTEAERVFFSQYKIPHRTSFAEMTNHVQEWRKSLGPNFLNTPATNSVAMEAFNSTEFMDTFIAEACPEVDALAERMKTEIISTEEEISIVDPCVRMISQADAVETTVHEVGHNFSLRHNFIGSFDVANWVDEDEFELKYFNNKISRSLFKPVSSSVMEYTAGQEKNAYPGKYDIAAIRWIYGSQVEMADGSIKTINTDIADGQSIDEALRSGEQLKTFEFCTDQHTILTSPFCMTRDKGTSQKEIVLNMIDGMYRGLSNLYRYDRILPRGAGVPFFQLKSHYDQWRFYVSEFMGNENGYLKSIDRATYQNIVQAMLNDPQNGELYREALESRNLVVKALLDVAMLNNKYCVIEDSEGDQFALELAKIRNSLVRQGDRTDVASCSSPSAEAYIEDVRKMKLVREVGHFIDGGQFTLNQFAQRWIDFVGSGSARINAFVALTQRFSLSFANIESGFSPNMMDEPDIREYVQEILMDRIVNGVRINDRNFNLMEQSEAKLLGAEDINEYRASQPYINFEDEAQFLAIYTDVLYGSLFIPDFSSATENFVRTSQWQVGSTNNPDLLGDEVQDVVFTGSVYYWTRSQSGYVNDLFAKMRQIRLDTALENIGVEQLSGFKDQILTMAGEILPQDNNAITLGDLISIVEFADSFGLDPSSPVTSVVSGMFQLERDILAEMSQVLQSQGIDLAQLYGALNDEETPEDVKAQIQEQVDQLETIPVANIYVEFLQDPANIEKYGAVVVPSAGGVNLRFDSYIERVEASSKIVSKNDIELDAQLNVINTILSILD